MTSHRNENSYALIMPVGPDGKMAAMDLHNTRWKVAVARPTQGSTTERDLSEVQDIEDAESAARAFIALMNEGLTGVLDSPNLRIFTKNPETFGDDLTDAMHEDCDDIPEEDRRDDDWDNTEFSQLRDAVMDILEDASSTPTP
ncbi:hypothetical protein KUV57_12215 [Epibacterium sp. DP7N7-1]|nr:hypothetical protein [Epibacterium sp. DP7N7-1]